MPNTLKYRNGSDFYGSQNNDASVYKTFAGTITTTGTVTCWTPASGKKFVLKGFCVNAAVSVILAGTGTSLWLVDNAYATATLYPISAFGVAQAAGTLLRTGLPTLVPVLSSRGGIVSGAADRVLKLACDADISTGKITVSGIVWGDEV